MAEILNKYVLNDNEQTPNTSKGINKMELFYTCGGHVDFNSMFELRKIMHV